MAQQLMPRQAIHFHISSVSIELIHPRTSSIPEDSVRAFIKSQDGGKEDKKSKDQKIDDGEWINTDAEDSHMNICNKCIKGGTLECCHTCSRAFHKKCVIGKAKARLDHDDWTCEVCNSQEGKLKEMMSRLEKCDGSSDIAWIIWRFDVFKSFQRLSRDIDVVKRRTIQASIRNSKMHRLFLLLQNHTGKWYKLVAPKKRELPTPVQINLKDGSPLTSHEDRMRATEDLHYDWARNRGEPIPSLRQSKDESGRTWYTWIENDQEYQKAVEDRLVKIRTVEAVRNAQKMCEEWERSERTRMKATEVVTSTDEIDEVRIHTCIHPKCEIPLLIHVYMHIIIMIYFIS